MKRLFVSLTMKGKTDDEIQKGIREAYEKVKTLYPQEIPYLQAAKVLREVSDAPAADVDPVVHGRWIYYPDCGVTRCSHCGWSIEECWESKHCPECGARMDLEEEK